MGEKGGVEGGGGEGRDSPLAVWKTGADHTTRSAERVKEHTEHMCGNHDHLSWALRHVSRIEWLSHHDTFSMQDVKDAWDITQSFAHGMYKEKYMLLQVKANVVQLVGPTPLQDDFSAMCLDVMLPAIRIVLNDHPLPDMLFIYSTRATLQQSPALAGMLHVPVFCACIGADSPIDPAPVLPARHGRAGPQALQGAAHRLCQEGGKARVPRRTVRHREAHALQKIRGKRPVHARRDDQGRCPRGRRATPRGSSGARARRDRRNGSMMPKSLSTRRIIGRSPRTSSSTSTC